MFNKFYTSIVLFIVCHFGYSQTTNQNYVKEIIYPSGKVVNSVELSNNSNFVTTTFLDGLGRTIQIIDQNSSPDDSKNIVTHIEYEKNIGQVKQYLPFTSTGYVAGSGQFPINNYSSTFVTNAKDETFNFYNSEKYEFTANPYSENKVERSPNKRIIETSAPGEDWKMENGKTIKTNYSFNGVDEVKKFEVSTTWNTSTGAFTNTITLNGNYPLNLLHKTVVKNENWTSGNNNTTVEFKGVDGKVILKRTYNNNDAHDTYYVYDFYGNLAYVIPPLANGSIDGNNLNNLCYQYVYDKKNRLIEKKIPQKNWEFIVYDNADRIVLTGPVYSPFSDGSQGWMFSKYDDLNRMVYSGFYKGSSFKTHDRKSLQDQVNNQSVLNEVKLANKTQLNEVTIQYSNNVFPTTGVNVLTINYFDNYAFPSAPTSFPAIAGVATIEKVKGMPTGNWTRNLTTPTQANGNTSHTLYNSKFQPLRSYSINHLGGTIQTDSYLKFSGIPNYSITTYKKDSGSAVINVRNDYTYDRRERLLTQKQTINSQTPEMIVSNVYDELGVLKTKNVGGVTGNLQKVDYKYNIRGWLTDINKDVNALFNYHINYNKKEGIQYGTSLYNGNINSITWRTSTDNINRGTRFAYDHLNRLNNSSGLYFNTATQDYKSTEGFNENASYDKNGNIISLYRTGYPYEIQGNEIDELVYKYEGNQLMSVTDHTAHDEGFNDQNTVGDDYVYDSYGNMTVDKNKKISNIKYNHLNLPTEITFDSGKILYTYDAAGTKIKKVVQPTNGNEQTTEYVNGFQYLNGVLQFFPHSEGYAKHNGNNTFMYVYQYKDHLGNVRLSYADINANGIIEPANEILEENNYYPFGLQHQGYNHVANNNKNEAAEKYKFLNKEYEDSFALNVTETDFRQYDSALGRFNVIDPFAELAYDFTPYRYGFNNPVYFADPSGLFESFFEAVTFLLENNQSGTVTPHLHGGFYVTIIAGEFEGEKFYRHASMLETVEIKSNGKSGGNNSSNKDNGFGINFTSTTGGSNGPVMPRNGGRYTYTIVSDIIMLIVDLYGPETKVGVDTDAINALNQKKYKIKEKNIEIESDEDFLKKHELMKIERPQFQQEFIFEKTNIAIRRKGFDTIINKNDYPSILKKFEKDSLKHVK